MLELIKEWIEWRMAYKFEYTARKGRFPSQPHQNPKGVHEVENQEGNYHGERCQILDHSRSGKKIEKPIPSHMLRKKKR
ncbi:hypothetical protein AAG906_012016 [Vitis piasezkii]